MARHGDRQVPAGIVVAEQHVGDGRPALLAGPPGLEDRRHVRGGPADGERPPVDEHHDGGRPGLLHRFDQFLLPAGQVQAGHIVALAVALGVLAHHHDGQLGLGRRRPGRLDFVQPALSRIDAFDVGDLGVRAHLALDSFEHRDDMLEHVAGKIVAQLRGRIVGIGADHRDRFRELTLERKQFALVLQQHDALARRLRASSRWASSERAPGST